MDITSWEFLFGLALHYSPRNVLAIYCGVDLLPIQSWGSADFSWVLSANAGPGHTHGYRPVDKLLLLQHWEPLRRVSG